MLRVLRALSSPLLPDDYLELVNPLWSTRELRGRVERVEPEAGDAVTVLIRPGYDWAGHVAGQYLRIGVDLDGRRHWRAYSLTSDPGRPDGLIAITPKRVEAGVVSPYLTGRARRGDIVRLGGVEGTFTLPDPLPPKLLFVSAGSGITPVMSMLRTLARREAIADVVHVHSARDARDVIFGAELRRLARRHAGLELVERHTGGDARLTGADLDALCEDWQERRAFLCGPRELTDALAGRYEDAGRGEQVHTERFGPATSFRALGSGGTVRLRATGLDVTCDGATPILRAGEEAGARLPYGCRMGICHTCVGRLVSGEVRDLRTGAAGGQPGEMIRTCVSAPEGPVVLEL